MRRKFCLAKVLNAVVTKRQVEHEGSCGIDSAILEASGIRPYEWILIVNAKSGQRFETYAIPEPAGSGVIALYGGAALLANIGDPLILMCAGDLEESEWKGFSGPKVLRLQGGNKVPSGKG